MVNSKLSYTKVFPERKENWRYNQIQRFVNKVKNRVIEFIKCLRRNTNNKDKVNEEDRQVNKGKN